MSGHLVTRNGHLLATDTGHLSNDCGGGGVLTASIRFWHYNDWTPIAIQPISMSALYWDVAPAGTVEPNIHNLVGEWCNQNSGLNDTCLFTDGQHRATANSGVNQTYCDIHWAGSTYGNIRYCRNAQNDGHLIQNTMFFRVITSNGAPCTINIAETGPSGGPDLVGFPSGVVIVNSGDQLGITMSVGSGVKDHRTTYTITGISHTGNFTFRLGVLDSSQFSTSSAWIDS